MLQFANYLALEMRYPDIEIFADIRRYNTNNIHNGLELENLFPIKLNVLYGKRGLVLSTYKKYIELAKDKFIYYAFKLNFLGRYKIMSDKPYFNEEVFNLNPKNNYLFIGQWGNEKYFKNAESELFRYFTTKIPCTKEEEELATKLNNCESVGIHIRRGDYTKLDYFFVDLCKTDYYKKAIEYISGIRKNPIFFVFSDDIEWVQKNNPLGNNHDFIYVSKPGSKKGYADMQLMSLCKDQIIANSTFSWWGGYLNRFQGKHVICPGHLFHDQEFNNKVVAEFYPPSWNII
jgi:hypothetical protein